MHLLNYTLEYALQLRRSMENLILGSWVIGCYSLCQLGHLFRDSLDWPAEDQSSLDARRWLQSALGQHKGLPSSWTKKFPASANSELKFSGSALVWLLKNIAPKSPRNACHQQTKIHKMQCKNIWTATLAASGCGCEQWTSRLDMHNPPQDKWVPCKAACHFWCTGQLSCTGWGQAYPVFWLPSVLSGWCMPTGKLCIEGQPEILCHFIPRYWPFQELNWSGLLDDSHGLNKKNSCTL
jgi:hypothetical protein